MEFLFHSVYNDGQKSIYYNVYKIDEDHVLAECHHFNRSRSCEGDFELVREGTEWKTSEHANDGKANHIAEELAQWEEGHEIGG